MMRSLRKTDFKNLNPNDISKIINYYTSTNRNAINIASKFGINKNTMYKILRHNNIPTRLSVKTIMEKANKVKIPKDLKGYIAGIVDGEGHVFITFTRTQNYLCGVDVMNTDKRVLEFFVKYFGGNILLRKRAKPNHKDSYRWQCFGSKAAKLCRCILPYLIVKRKQAELLLEFSKTLRKGPNENYKLSKKVENKRKMLIKKIKVLNKRGV
ncbi:MAG: hypothetical protein ABIE55_02005 [Candidatus Aenigmatarchaeota archaeon]